MSVIDTGSGSLFTTTLLENYMGTGPGEFGFYATVGSRSEAAFTPTRLRVQVAV